MEWRRGSFFGLKSGWTNANPFNVRGGFLRVKIQGKEEERRWCPFSYEFLPDFCYICGILGHIQNFCPSKSKEIQFGPNLRAQKTNRNLGEDRSRLGGVELGKVEGEVRAQ